MAVRTRAEHYLFCQTRLLQWIATRPAAAELFSHTPTLLWLLLSKAHDADWPEPTVDHIVLRQRSEILGWLTGIDSPSAVKFINKIRLLNGDHREFTLILHSLASGQQPLWHEFSQWPAIPIHILSIRLSFPELVGTHLLKTLAQSDYGRLSDATAHVARKMSLWRDTSNIGALLQITDAGRALGQCSTFEALERLHDRWTRRLNRHPTLACQSGYVFPPPPLLGTTAIQPIERADDLAEEGRLMQHCVATYARRVRDHRCYIYRMLEPERATIEIVLDRGEPLIGQFKLAGNREPGSAAWAAVYAWLESAKGGKAHSTHRKLNSSGN
jgi:hypothetical protein